MYIYIYIYVYIYILYKYLLAFVTDHLGLSWLFSPLLVYYYINTRRYVYARMYVGYSYHLNSISIDLASKSQQWLN